MTTQHPQDGHPSSSRCSPTILRMLTNHPHECHKASYGQSPTIPRMVTHLPKVSPPPKLCWLPIIPRKVTHHEWTSHHHSHDGHIVSLEWLTNIQMKVVHPRKVGQPPTAGWSPTIHHPKNDHHCP